MPADWSPVWLSLRSAGLAAVLAVLIAWPLAWLLAHRRFTGSELLDTLANLPLMAPPAVLIYYLLSTLGLWPLRFSWRAAVLVSAIYTLPLPLHAARAGFASVDRAFENAARSLGAGEWRTFRQITLPLAWPALLAALLAGFARAFADFLATAVCDMSAGAGWLLFAAALALAASYLSNRMLRVQAAP